MIEKSLLPWHHRYVNGAGSAFSTNRFDRVVHFRQAETMCREQLEREAMRRKLLKAQFDGPVRVAARALERHPFACQTADGKVWELRVPLALDHHRRAAPFGGLDAKQHGRRPGAARAINDDIYAPLLRQLEDTGKRVLLLYIDDRVRPHCRCNLQPAGIA